MRDRSKTPGLPPPPPAKAKEATSWEGTATLRPLVASRARVSFSFFVPSPFREEKTKNKRSSFRFRFALSSVVAKVYPCLTPAHPYDGLLVDMLHAATSSKFLFTSPATVAFLPCIVFWCRRRVEPEDQGTPPPRRSGVRDDGLHARAALQGHLHEHIVCPPLLLRQEVRQDTT